MGKFSDWMMKGSGDDESKFNYDERQSQQPDNNFDRFYANRLQNERPRQEVQREPVQRRGLFSRSERSEFTRRDTPQPSQPQSKIGNNVVIYSPKTYEDVQTLIDYLKRAEPVVVNLSGIADDSAQRILDFMSGAVYALSGSIKRITGSLYMLTPSGVNIMMPVNDKK